MSVDPKSIQQALDLHNTGRLAEAEAAYRAILAHSPNEADVLHLLGVACSQQGHKDEAVRYITRSISLKPGAPEFHSNLAMVYLEQGLYEQSAAAAQSALALRPDYSGAMNILANALRALGRLDQSIHWFERSLATRSDQPDVLSALTDLLRQTGRNDQAEERMRQAVSLQSAAHDSLVTHGQSLLNENRLEEAGGVFQSLMQRFPQSWVGFNGLALVLVRLGRFNEALPLFHKSIEIAPDKSGPYNNVGQAYLTQGHIEQAIEFLKKLWQLAPILRRRTTISAARIFSVWILPKRGALSNALCFSSLIIAMPIGTWPLSCC